MDHKKLPFLKKTLKQKQFYSFALLETSYYASPCWLQPPTVAIYPLLEVYLRSTG